jgi:hypothetical protein
VKHFHHEIVELGSRFPRDYAIIHSAVLSFVCFFGNGYYTRTDGETDSVFVVRLGLGRSGGGRKSPRRPDASPMRVSASGAFRSAASIRNVERPQGRSRRVLRGELAPVAGLARKQSAKESFGARLEGARTAPEAVKTRASASTGAREDEKS